MKAKREKKPTASSTNDRGLNTDEQRRITNRPGSKFPKGTNNEENENNNQDA